MHEGADLGELLHAEGVAEHLARQSARGDDAVAVGHGGEQRRDVGGFDHLEEGVGGIALESTNAAGGVEKGQSFFGGEVANGGFVETFFVGDHKMLAVVEEEVAHDAPEIVDEVGVIEVHAPTIFGRRETAEKEHAPVFGQEGGEGVRLDGQFVLSCECIGRSGGRHGAWGGGRGGHREGKGGGGAKGADRVAHTV